MNIAQFVRRTLAAAVLAGTGGMLCKIPERFLVPDDTLPDLSREGCGYLRDNRVRNKVVEYRLPDIQWLLTGAELNGLGLSATQTEELEYVQATCRPDCDHRKQIFRTTVEEFHRAVLNQDVNTGTSELPDPTKEKTATTRLERVTRRFEKTELAFRAWTETARDCWAKGLALLNPAQKEFVGAALGSRDRFPEFEGKPEKPVKTEKGNGN